ncbi:unnamed protein product [Coccothraustes coccothraustes]
MSMDKEMSTEMEPKKKWLMFHRRQKVRDGAARRARPGLPSARELLCKRGRFHPGGPFILILLVLRTDVGLPSPSQVEARRQWAIATAKILLAGLPSEEGDSSEDVQGSGSSSGDESVCVSCEAEPKPLQPCKGTGHLELTPQTRDQAAAKGEDRKSKELSEEKSSAITIRSIWVNPHYPQLLVQPDTPLEEEADGDLPSTSRALAAPREAQAAAAALPGAPEDEMHPVRATALPQEAAKTAASAGPGAQAAAAES